MKQYIEILDSDNYIDLLSDKVSAIFYFNQESCSVGVSIKEKLLELVNSNFPQLDCYFINIEKLPNLSAQLSIFVYPTILVFLEGQEYYRYSRNLSISQIKEQLSRPYHMLYEL